MQARQRGVLFDVGHGVGSFAYRVARAAIAQGFPPDTISSDLHAHNVAGPAYDQATTLSKLLHVGMGLADVIRADHGHARPPRSGGRTASARCSPAGRQTSRYWSCDRGTGRCLTRPGRPRSVERLIVPRMVVRAGEVQPLSADPAGTPIEPGRD